MSKGYFDAPGSSIQFSLINRGGELYLQQKAVANHSAIVAQLGVDTGYTSQVWNTQAAKLAILLGLQPKQISH